MNRKIFGTLLVLTQARAFACYTRCTRHSENIASVFSSHRALQIRTDYVLVLILMCRYLIFSGAIEYARVGTKLVLNRVSSQYLIMIIID